MTTLQEWLRLIAHDQSLDLSNLLSKAANKIDELELALNRYNEDESLLKHESTIAHQFLEIEELKAYAKQQDEYHTEVFQRFVDQLDAIKADAIRFEFLCKQAKCSDLNIDGDHTWNFNFGKGWTAGATFREAVDNAIVKEGGLK